MAGPTQFTIEIDRWVEKIKGRIGEFCIEVAQDIAEEVVRTTPYKTGFLRGSWWASIGTPAVQAGKPDLSGGTTIAQVTIAAAQFSAGETYYLMNGAHYAGFVHNGTSRMAARPWVSNVVVRANGIAAAAAKRVGGE